MPKKLTIKEMRKIAESRSGLCLSEKYYNQNTKLRWRCNDGHEWDAIPSSVKYGRWCPICSSGITERICRKIFERIFNENFPKEKPKWLISDSGSRLELDGYCEKLGIAFEHNGKQHYEHHAFFHRERTRKMMDLTQQRRIDGLKKKLCESHNVKLIEIPYTVKKQDLSTYIRTECERQGIQILKKGEIDYRFLDVFSSHHLQEMQALAERNGGKCLSKVYIDSQTKLRWRCKKDHQWNAVPASVQTGRWCRICSREITASKERLSIEEMKEIANSHGGVCLSEKYVNNWTKLHWKCKYGHEWNAVPASIRTGYWCPFCAGVAKLTIEDMQKLAELKEGMCLSNKYLGANIPLHWRCTEGHEWYTKPSHISSGSWCPFCANRALLTIDEMKAIAKSRGGVCLSKNYVNGKTKLRWRCKEGHGWEAVPNSVKRGSWCPTCANIKKKRKK